MTLSKRTRALAAVGTCACLVTAAACHTVAQPGPNRPSVSDSIPGGGHPTSEGRLDLGGPLASTRASSSTPLPTTPTPTTSPHWSYVPEKETAAGGGLYTALDGMCEHVSVSLFQNEAVVMFGSALARATDDALTVDPALNAGYGGSGYEVVGRWPDAAYLLYDNGSRCTSSVRAKHYQNGKWEEAFALPQDHSVRKVALLGNGAVGVRDCNWSCSSSENSDCGQGMFIGDNAKAPPIAGDGFQPSAYEILPSGEVFAVGVVCSKDTPAKCNGQLRWWSPGAKVGYLPLSGGVSAPTYGQSAGWLVVKSKTEVYVSQGDFFGSFDGAKLTRITTPSKAKTFKLYDAKANGIWVETADKVFERKPDGTFTDVTPPVFFTNGQLAGVEVGAPWYLAAERTGSAYWGKNGLYKRIGSDWQTIELPRPARASSEKSYLTGERLTVRAPDDVFVVATYHEMPNGWNEAERRRVLLRTKRPKETLRCGGPSRLEGWPPPALDSCTTPFVVFAETSPSSPKDYDYPQTRRVLGPKAELVVDGSLAEIRENGRLWIGAAPKSVDAGRKLVELYAKTWQYSRPEVLCATPTVTRKIAIAAK